MSPTPIRSVRDTYKKCQHPSYRASAASLRQRESHKRTLPRRAWEEGDGMRIPPPSKNTFHNSLRGAIPAAKVSILLSNPLYQGLETIYCYFVCCMLSLLSFVSIATSSSFTLTSLFYFNIALFLLLRHPVLFLRHPEQSRRVSEHLIRHLELVERSLRCGRDDVGRHRKSG